MRTAPGTCDRCGKPVGGFGTFCWNEREMGTVSFAWADCGCGRGSEDAAIVRRAARVSPQLARAAKAAIARYRVEKKQRAVRRASPEYLSAVMDCPCPDCKAIREEMQQAGDAPRCPS